MSTIPPSLTSTSILTTTTSSMLAEISSTTSTKLIEISSACDKAISEISAKEAAHETKVAALSAKQHEWETAHASVRRNLANQAEHVKLNIGGVYYQTSKSTLVRLPYFKAMLGGGFENETDAEGFFFVDRNGEHFVHILSYLRGSLLDETVTSMSEEDRAGVLLEAEFYQAPEDFLKRFTVPTPIPQLVVGSVFSFDYSQGMAGIVISKYAGCYAVTVVNNSSPYRGRLFLRVKSMASSGCVCELDADSAAVAMMWSAGVGSVRSATFTLADAHALPGFELE